MFNEIQKLSYVFEKIAQLQVGQSTISFQQAKNIAQEVKEGLEQIQPELLNNYNHKSIDLVVKSLLNGELPNSNLIQSAISEFYSGLNSFVPLVAINFAALKNITV